MFGKVPLSCQPANQCRSLLNCVYVWYRRPALWETTVTMTRKTNDAVALLSDYFSPGMTAVHYDSRYRAAGLQHLARPSGQQSDNANKTGGGGTAASRRRAWRGSSVRSSPPEVLLRVRASRLLAYDGDLRFGLLRCGRRGEGRFGPYNISSGNLLSLFPM